MSLKKKCVWFRSKSSLVLSALSKSFGIMIQVCNCLWANGEITFLSTADKLVRKFNLCFKMKIVSYANWFVLFLIKIKDGHKCDLFWQHLVQKWSTVLVLNPRLSYIGLYEGNKGLHLPNGLQSCKDHL